MNKRILSKLAVLCAALTATAVQAVPEIPEKSGWRGQVNLAAGAGTSESNMIHSISSIDLGQEKISSLNESPDSEEFFLPGVQFELAYTLGENRTQFYLGNLVADYTSFDLQTSLQTHLGVRQEIPGITVVDISLSRSTLPLDVWKDPYIVDAKRGDTERTVNGLHMAFDRIFGTGLELKWSSSEIEIDDERSGEDLGLSSADQNALKREGQVYNVKLLYDWKINEQHRLTPTIGWVDRDLDGSAMAEDGMAYALKYLYERNRWIFVSQVFYEDLESDSRNPIYNKQGSVDKIGGVFTAFYTRPFGLENWTANATVGYQDNDSNIDFYDSTFGLVSIGMLYRFD
jgi:hypothetical protein